MFASGGDPGYGSRPDPGWAPYDTGGPPSGSTEDAAVGVARRLQARLDRHLWLLDQLYPEPPQLRELKETARRIRRDSESLVLLTGDSPGGQSGGPRRLSDVMDDAAAAAEETWRILVRPASPATVEAGASVELLHVLAEVLDHVTAAYPDAGIDVASHVGERRGLTVEVSVNSAGRYAPDGLGARRAASAAEAHARRSRCGLLFALPAGGPPRNGTGVVATISCPAPAMTIDEPAWSSVITAGRQPLPAVASSGTNGNGWGPGHHGANGSGHQPMLLDPPTYVPSASSHVDELFGPIVDLPFQPTGESSQTPIFEAIASAWFREEQGARAGGTDPLNWESPADTEWREAAARVSQSEPLPSTASGLPRRRPGSQLVPPPRSRPSQPGEATERVPDRVRNRLSTYQRGLRQGRHRAPGPDSERW
jgi:hypothetical protein